MYAIRSYYVKTEIDLGSLPAETPAALRRLLRRCLERQPKNRLHDIADARIVIDEVLAGEDEASGEHPAASAAGASRLRCVITSYSIHYTKLYDLFAITPAR